MIKELILPLALSSELNNSKPIRVHYQGSNIVLFRSGGHPKAFLDRCPHRGYPLSDGRVRDNKLICPYHGWVFDDEGRVVDIPGDSDFKSSSSCLLQGLNVIEKDGLIWGSESEISEDKFFSPSVHHSHDVVSIVRTINADRIDIAENFLDALHTHTVHTGIIRSSKHKHKCSVLVTNIDDGYQAEYTEEKKQTGLLSNLFGGNITKSIGRIRYPGIIELEYLSDVGIEMSVVIYLIEETQSSCKLIMRTYLRRTKAPFLLKAALLTPLQIIVFYQDKKVLETQAKSLQSAQEFKPIVRKTDIMREAIEKTFNREFEDCLEHIEILL